MCDKKKGEKAVRTKLMIGCLVGVLLGLSGAAQPATAAVTVDLTFFHDRLAPYGDWIQHQRYGWVWHPTVVEMDWRPYVDGHWVMTDEYGWLWESDYDWGWAPFHYGRWAYDEEFGWVWVPGYEWGPAWVGWRQGDGYLGWAPLPPEVGWDAVGGLQLGSFDLDMGLYQPSWVFVEERYFLAPRLREVIFEPERNLTIIERTRNVTNYVTVDNRVVNRSISVERIEKVTGARVEHFKVNEVERVASGLGPRTDRHTINVFRPVVRPAPARATPPTAAEADRIHAARQAMLQERHQAELDRLAQRHQQEREQAGVDAEQLRRQQEAERQALIEKQRSEERALENARRPAAGPSTPHGRR
jgi:hypothetical protein